MSHEIAERGRTVRYKAPARPSDSLRSLQFSQFFSEYHGAAFAVRTIDGWAWASGSVRAPAFVATFRTRDQLDAVIGDARETTLGRIFLDGDLDIQGDIFALLAVAEYTLRHAEGLSGNLIRLLARMRVDLSKRLTPWRRHAAVQNWHCAPCPLDLPVEFFESWLGSLLAHSCAMFRKPEEDLESAQRNALERACCSLRLDRGDRLLDVSCGWGSLMLHAAAHCGADVQGITSSDLQAEVAAERIGRTGLGRRCAVECRDLRRTPYRAEGFDKIADIGIFEQVASADLGEYLACMQQMLVPGGLLLLHRMTRPRTARAPQSASLPRDLSLEPLSREMETAEAAGLEVLSVESLQREYEQTLRVWIEQLRQSWTRTTAEAVNRGRRAWLLYLVEMAANLQTGDLQVHRMVLRRPQRARTLGLREWLPGLRLSGARNAHPASP